MKEIVGNEWSVAHYKRYPLKVREVIVWYEKENKRKRNEYQYCILTIINAACATKGTTGSLMVTS